MKSIKRYEDLTAKQLKSFQDQGCIILLSFGSLEQHSSHLPVGTDFLCSQARVEKIARETESIVFTPIQIGYSFNHLGMFGTVSFTAETMLSVIYEILISLCKQGWKKILIFSGHAGNWPTIEVAVQKTKEHFPSEQIALARNYPRMSHSHNLGRFYKSFDLHAGLVETAIVSYYFNDLLDKNNIPKGNNKIPNSIKNIISKEQLDDVDELLIKTLIPQHTSLVSSTGNWGIGDPSCYSNVPVKEAMENYCNFFIKFIERWKKIEV